MGIYMLTEPLCYKSSETEPKVSNKYILKIWIE
jgi:hypothetical protein